MTASQYKSVTQNTSGKTTILHKGKADYWKIEDANPTKVYTLVKMSGSNKVTNFPQLSH